MESLSQLVESGFTVNGTTVTDKPRYAFRAIMIDTSRHFYPLTAIKQNLDAMASVVIRPVARQLTLFSHLARSLSFLLFFGADICIFLVGGPVCTGLLEV